MDLSGTNLLNEAAAVHMVNLDKITIFSIGFGKGECGHK